MVSIKQLFTSKNHGHKSASSHERLTLEDVYRDQPDTTGGNEYATTSFTPTEHGREETTALLHPGTSESLGRLLKEHDQAAREAQRAPRTKGTKEVQRILQHPSHDAVEKLSQARQQAEMAARYGTPGVVAYNFSKTLGWNKSSAPVPAPQAKGVKAGMKASGSTSAAAFSPINWLELSTSATGQGAELHPLISSSEYGRTPQDQPLDSWPADGAGMDMADLRPGLSDDVLLRRDEDWDEDEWTAFDIDATQATPFTGNEASAVRITSVRGRQVHHVLIGAHEPDAGLDFSEISGPPVS